MHGMDSSFNTPALARWGQESAVSGTTCHYEARFVSLFNGGRGVSFPCDAQGCVAMEHMTERARQNYQRVRSLVGTEYAAPAVQLSDLH